jgi:hypothetical protein
MEIGLGKRQIKLSRIYQIPLRKIPLQRFDLKVKPLELHLPGSRCNSKMCDTDHNAGRGARMLHNAFEMQSVPRQSSSSLLPGGARPRDDKVDFLQTKPLITLMYAVRHQVAIRQISGSNFNYICYMR